MDTKHQDMKKLNTAGLVVIQGDSILLAYSKNKQAWYLPGGKIDAGETSLQALIREISEELNVTLRPEDISFYCHIQALAYGEQQLMMEQDCFLYQQPIDPKPSLEIEKVAYFNLETYAKETVQVPGVIKLFEQLKADQRIHY